MTNLEIEIALRELKSLIEDLRRDIRFVEIIAAAWLVGVLGRLIDVIRGVVQ